MAEHNVTATEYSPGSDKRSHSRQFNDLMRQRILNNHFDEIFWACLYDGVKSPSTSCGKKWPLEPTNEQLPRQNDSHKAKQLRPRYDPITLNHTSTSSCLSFHTSINSHILISIVHCAWRSLQSRNPGRKKENDMCYQNIEKHICAHTTRYKPHFCRYRFNINHQIEPKFTYIKGLCKECLAGRVDLESAKAETGARLCGVNAQSSGGELGRTMRFHEC
jgi:hypothetical protein